MTTLTGEELLKHVLHSTRKMAEARTLEPLLSYAMEQVLHLAGAEQGFIVLRQAPEGLEFKITRTQDGREVAGYEDEISLTILNEVINSGQSLVLQNAMIDERFRQAESVVNLRLRSIMCVPLITRNDVIGAIYVENRAVQNRFRENDVAPLELFANQAAVAIENAALNDENRRHAARLEQRVLERTRELAEANERLQELDRLKSKFVSDVSHELRTPITNLKLYLDLLAQGRPEAHAKYIGILKREVGRLQQLVEDILDLSRVEMGKRKGITFAPINLNEVAAQIVTAHQPRAREAGLSLSFVPGLGLLPVRGEANQLAQAVSNLITNALNYTIEGQVTLSTRPSDDGRFACLQVQDTGIGIEEEDYPHLFARFYRGQSISQLRIPGTGLGLAIVKEIVDLHDGYIEVESEVGQGSVFRLCLPYGNAEE
jgi:signal transduction histidine kinase